MTQSGIKRRSFCAVAAVGALICSLSSARAETWALIVGVSKYQSPQIASLKFPADDARAIADALSKRGGVPAGHIRLLTDDAATRAGIQGAVGEFLKPHVKNGDTVIVSLAGHGVAKGVGLDAKGYFLGTDVRGASKEAMDATAVDLRAFCTEIGTLPAAQFILFVDACREDPTPGRGLKPNSQSDSLQGSTRIVPQNGGTAVDSVTFYACQVGQRAYEDAAYKHGVFTYYVLDAIDKAAGAEPDGRIEMGHLASYVKANVREWAAKSAIDQTPELTFNDPNPRSTDPIYLVKVSGAPSAPFTLLPPVLAIDTEPDTATILLNGAKVDKLPAELKAGDNSIRVEAPGFAPVEKRFRALPGYQYRMSATLSAAGPVAPAAESQISIRFEEAQRAEAQQHWDDAINKYSGLVGDKFAPAYERLAALQGRQGRPDSQKQALDTLVKLNVETNPTSHSYSLLARAYSAFALRDAAQNSAKAEPEKKNDVNIGGIKLPGNIFGGRKKKPQEPRSVADPEKVGDFRVPENGATAGALARKAAEEAAKADPNSVDTQLAQGFSLVATDADGKNGPDAIAAFRSAAATAPNDATANYSLGYGLYYFARDMKNRGEREKQVEEAITSLDKAIELRPNYYEALRIRGFCHHLLGHNKQAQQDYESAIANRGSATDPDEVASLNMTQSVLLRQEAKSENGERKTELMDASNGYADDGKELARDLNVALAIMGRIGLPVRLSDFLPSSIINIPGAGNVLGRFHF